MTDDYTPSDEDMRKRHRHAWEQSPVNRYALDEADAQWSRWLAAHDARVRRDAAREALDGLINECRTKHEEAATNNRVGGMVLELHTQQAAMNYRVRNYPETKDQT